MIDDAWILFFGFTIFILLFIILAFALDTCGRYNDGVDEGLRRSKYTDKELAFAERYHLSYESARRVLPHMKQTRERLSQTDVNLIAKWADDAENKKRIEETILNTSALVPKEVAKCHVGAL